MGTVNKPLKRVVNTLAFVIAGLPLIAYPLVFMANVMSLAGHSTGNESFWLVLVSNCFLIGTTVYPLVFGLSLIFFFTFKMKLTISLIPLGYLVLLFLLFQLWGFLE